MVILKVLKGIRNHWKKSLFAAGVVSYGVSYANEKYEIDQLMRSYCEQAVQYGEQTIPDAAVPPKRILVILNPAANKKSAEKSFTNYCAPVLNLAGFLVDIVKTDSEGHAVRYVEELDQLPSAILVAGGDGTLSETVTGLLRRPKKDKCPIGVLPVGRTNSVANKIYHLPSNASGVDEVRGLAESAMSVIRGKTTKKNIMEVQPLSEEGEAPRKPFFALGSLHWGAFRDAKNLRDKYWYFGPLREYAASFFNAFGNKLTWDCKAQINYTPPCPGCKNCYVKEPAPYQPSTGRWWSRFIPRFSVGQARAQVPEYSKVENENCSKVTATEVSSTELILNVNDEPEQSNVSENRSCLEVNIGETVPGSFSFISKSWSRIRNEDEIDVSEKFQARTVELIPEQASSEGKSLFYSIDNEAFEVLPIRIKLVPKAIDMYTV